MINKHNVYNKMQEVNKMIGFILTDFSKKYDLKVGCRYRIEMADGKCFDGFFRHLKASLYHNKLDVWCCFYRSKKDGMRSKITSNVRMSKITTIKL